VVFADKSVIFKGIYLMGECWEFGSRHCVGARCI